MRQILELEVCYIDNLFDYQRLGMTQNDQSNFKRALECDIGHRCFNEDNVRDHDKLTGNCRGAEYERCNLMLKKTYKVPLFFHNFRGSDSLLIVWGLRSLPRVNINRIDQGMEKYPKLGWGEHRIFKEPAVPCKLA